MSFTLTPEIAGVRFASRFADVEALMSGDPGPLTPQLTDEMQALWSAPRETPSTALVLGGNGFVGAHLVAQLSVQPGLQEVTATVRGQGGDPRVRLEATVRDFEITAIDWSRIRVIDATPTRPRFGLEREAYEALAARTDLVFNCASSTDYSVPYLELRADWTLSMLRVLRFCATTRPKHLSYVGSIGRYLYQQPEDFQRPDSWWYSGYAQMKWVNAAILLSLAEQGLPVSLCDTHYVFGATDVGLDPGRHYSWWRAIELSRGLGQVWQGAGLNYVPVDVLVQALTVNALAAQPMARMLPRNVVDYAMQVYADLLGLESLPWEEYRRVAFARAPRLAATLLKDAVDPMIRMVNEPAALFPPGVEPLLIDNSVLLGRYLERIDFRTPYLRPKSSIDLDAVLGEDLLVVEA